jgi:predicted CxxxxCH...CXXCH cytochrome family protein
MKILLVLLSIITLSSAASKVEKVKVDYELVLNRCMANSCHSESAAHGQAYVSLEEEDPTFAWGYTPVEENVGSVAYQLRFHLSRNSNGKTNKKTLVIGFSARVGTLTGKQVSWSEKKFSGKDWPAFAMTSTSGASYSDEQETITPTLQVLQVTTLP